MVTNVTQLIDFMFFYMNIIILEQKKAALSRAASFINQPKNLIFDLTSINPE